MSHKAVLIFDLDKLSDDQWKDVWLNSGQYIHKLEESQVDNVRLAIETITEGSSDPKDLRVAINEIIPHLSDQELQGLVSLFIDKFLSAIGDNQSIDDSNDEADPSYNQKIRRENILKDQIRSKIKELVNGI